MLVRPLPRRRRLTDARTRQRDIAGSGSGSGGNWGEGVYENDYVKQNGVWKISKLHLYMNFVAPYEGGWLNADKRAIDEYALGKGVMPDRPPSENYEPYPGVFLPPFHYKNPVSGK